MLQALRVSSIQALRSIILILLPIAFISLLTWATAGSASGNTADPIRATLWIFLAAHQIPLELSITNLTTSSALTFLPLGALLIPIFVVRNGFRRALEIGEVSNLDDKRKYLLGFAFSYSLIGFIVTIPALGKTVDVPFFLAIPILFGISFLISFITSGGLPRRNTIQNWERALRLATISISALVGFGSLFLAATLIAHFQVVSDLTRVVEPGFLGGITLLIAQLLYLPNFAISALSYLSGAGFAISEGTLISPFIHRIDEIPAVPLLGALPNSTLPIASLSILVVLAMGAVVANAVKDSAVIAWTALCFGLFTLVIARAASGELISSNLPSVGPIWWLMPILLTVEFGVGALAVRTLPILLSRVRRADES